MSNETKRDVFETFADKCAGLNDEIYKRYLKQYDAALPDDLPVIPEAVGKYIKRQKQGSTLRSAIIAATDFHTVDDEEADWIFYHSDTFVRAWVIGAWSVEETGEIVKLEVEK